MCFDHDSRPPIEPIAGGALDTERLTLQSADGTPFTAFRARAAAPIGAGMIVLPDVRGLHPYYEELTARFAERGVDAIGIDYFGRTAGLAPRPADFEFMPHVARTTMAGLRADIAAAAAALRAGTAGRPGPERVFAIGFCFGGRLAFVSASFDLDLEGVAGFYGWPVGATRNDVPAPSDIAARMRGRVLAIYGGADQAIPAEAIATFDAALDAAGVERRTVVYPDAPHSFFDRKAADFADASGAAWDEVLRFVGAVSA